jgi:flagellar hook-associated protein 3 FlgL
MRVTTAGQTQSLITRLQTSAQRFEEAQRRATTGLRVEKMSDDPTAGTAIMQAAGGLRGVTQYTRNVARVTASLDAEDSALQQVTDLLTRAKELGVASNSATVGAEGRAAAAAEVRQLFAQAVSLGNTKLGDEYLFGGLTNDGRPPFDPDAASFVPTDPPPAGSPPGTPGTPRFPRGTRSVEAGAGGQRVTGPHDGTVIFLGTGPGGAPDASTGVLPALQRLADALAGGDQTAVGAALGEVDTAFAGLQGRVGEVGARQNQADTVHNALAALELTLTEQKSDLSEVDAERAITEMLARQTAYQAAMLASSKVMGMSLTDYLR